MLEYDVLGAATTSPMQSWSKGVTKSAMYLYVNAWFPSWLGGERPATDRFTLVDWTEQSSRSAGSHQGFAYTETCERLSSVNGSPRQPPKRASGESPAMRAMRSSSAGQA